MAAKQNLRRENALLVPCRAGYLSGRSSAFWRKINGFPDLEDISSVLTEMT
jgi:hypothetical protein